MADTETMRSSCVTWNAELPADVKVAPEAALLFFDVDGTLVWMDESELEDSEFTDFGPNASVVEAFGRLHERGHHAFLCTGRPLSFIPRKVLDLGFTGCITAAGACVSFGDRIVHEDLIARDLLLEVAERALTLETPIMLESRETTVVLSRTGKVMAGFPDIPVVKSLDELEVVAPDLHFYKLFGMLEDRADPPRVIEEFRAYMSRHFIEANMGLAFEFALAGVDKGAAIERLLGALGHDKRNTFAFGDSENDLPMFPAVETAVAMGNAMDVLKARADYVTGHAAKDGIAQALEHFELI